MPRQRSVKPAFFTHAELYDAERDAGLPLRLAYAGLWTVADRAGRFEWRPRVLKLDVLPYDDVDFAAVLDGLERHGFVRSYTVDGKRYGEVPTLEAHQTFHHRERESQLPAPPWREPNEKEGEPRANPGLAQGKPESSPSDIGYRISETETETVKRTATVGDARAEHEPRPGDAAYLDRAAERDLVSALGPGADVVRAFLEALPDTASRPRAVAMLGGYLNGLGLSGGRAATAEQLTTALAEFNAADRATAPYAPRVVARFVERILASPEPPSATAPGSAIVRLPRGPTGGRPNAGEATFANAQAARDLVLRRPA